MFPNSNSQDVTVMSAADTARYLGVLKITLLRVRQRDARGGLPFVQLSPGRIGYLRRDVDAYLAARRIDGPTQQRAA
jgi:hypothetical protein